MYEQLLAQKNSLAHAYILEGEMTSVKEDLYKFLEKDLNIHTTANPDLFTKSTTGWKIDDIRELGVHASNSAVGQHGKVFVLIIGAITIEAQNAFLKTLEEAKNSKFFLLVSNGAILLPTILSRCVLIAGSQINSLWETEAQEYLKMNYTEREKFFTERFLGDKKKNIEPNRSEASTFTQELLHVLFLQNREIKNFNKIYKEVEEIAQYTQGRSSNLKQLCEFVALKVPVIK